MPRKEITAATTQILAGTGALLPSAQPFTTASFAGQVPYYPVGTIGGYVRGSTYAIPDSNRVRYFPFVVQRDSLLTQATASVACNVTATPGAVCTAQAQICIANGSRYYPDSLLVPFGDWDCGAVGVKTASPTQTGPWVLRAGQLYWMMFACSTVNLPTLDAAPRANSAFISPPFIAAAAGVNSIGALENSYTIIQSGVGGHLNPATYTWVSEATFPLIWLRVSG